MAPPPFPPDVEIASPPGDKAALRKVLRARRRALAADRARASQALADRGAELPVAHWAGLCVSVYLADAFEIDPAPLAALLAGRGARIVLPVVIARDRPLVFRPQVPTEALIPDAAGIPAPPPTEPDLPPDVVLAPLLGFDASGGRVLVISVLGRVHMDALDDPFSAVDKALDEAPLGIAFDAVIVDMHCEATSEKMAMGHFCDGRASLVIGTHTHVPTADAQVLPGGTAFQTDAGACADYDSVIGMNKSISVARFASRLPGERQTPATGPATVCGVFVETDPKTGLALRIEPIRVGGRLKPCMPEV